MGIVLMLVLALVLAACGDKKPAESSSAAPPASSDVASQAESSAVESQESSSVVATAQMPKGIVAVDAWNEIYPDYVKSYKENADMSKTTYGGSVPVDYLEEHPYLKNFYKGYVFEHQYDRARGHIYAYEDVQNTARPKAGASCLACKVSEFNEMLKDDPTLSKQNFEEYVKANPSVGFTCFDCHGETPGEMNSNRAHLLTAMKENDEIDKKIAGTKTVSCAQCHTEYYMTHEEKTVTLPWSEGLGAVEAFAYYEKHDFSDWEHPETGSKLLKAQHPETETFQGSVHDKLKLDCSSCHMPTQDKADGSTMHSHHWTSPLKNGATACLSCHTGDDATSITQKVEAIQKPVVEKTDELGKKLNTAVEKLAAAVKDGTKTPEELDELRHMHREAQFYWDYVFVENGEGFHHQQLQLDYLKHAEDLVDKMLAKLQ